MYTFCSIAMAESSTKFEDATSAYQQDNWQAVIMLLAADHSEPGAGRLLALSYYHVQDYENALPALEQARSDPPRDIEINTALLDILLAKKQFEQAKKVAADLNTMGAVDTAGYASARMVLAQDPTGRDRKQAIDDLQSVLASDNPALVTRVADLLIEELYQDKEYGQAYQVAQIALHKDPDSILAYRFSRIPPDSQDVSEFSLDLGYRLEYDTNVAYPDEEFASGEEDFRHVLMADLLYRRPFSGNWNFYAQGHVLQYFYNDLDQFNQTRLTGSVAIGQEYEKFGWRVPVEVVYDWLDGHSFRRSLAAIPGVYIPFGESYFGHLYIRLQHDDYDRFTFPEEDRSGDVTGGGVLVVGNISSQWSLRSYVEYNHYDTDGLYWRRDQFVAFVMAEFEFAQGWVAGMALRYVDEDYDNARPVFAQRQQDKSKELYLNITQHFAEKWRWRAQLSLIDHQSNISIFDYNRNVYSIGITREF